MIRTINVDAFLKELGTGVSKPVLVLGSDFEQYVLKNEKADHNGNKSSFNCMFLNELFAYQIGKYLNVPMPESVVAFVDKGLIEADPTLRFAYRYTEGNHFASKELQYVENNFLENTDTLIKMGKPYIKRSWNVFLSNVKNKSDIARILAFDLLISNFDRYANNGNILINNTELGRNLFAIDHGHAFFGPEWNTFKIGMLNSAEVTDSYINNCINTIININVKNGQLNGLGVIYKELENYIDLSDTNNHSFQDIIIEIESITEEQLDGWLDSIPDEWFIDKKMQIGYYKNFVLIQKTLIRHFIQILAARGAFSNYRGGILKWKKEKQLGTA